jgi:hypothetical protein
MGKKTGKIGYKKKAFNRAFVSYYKVLGTDKSAVKTKTKKKGGGTCLPYW